MNDLRSLSRVRSAPGDAQLGSYGAADPNGAVARPQPNSGNVKRGEQVSNAFDSHDVRGTREVLESTSVNESLWQAWLERGRSRERRSDNAGAKGIKWVAAAALFTAAALWSQFVPLEHAVRFIVTFGAILLTLRAFQARQYAFAAAFAALALLYNPVAPVFAFAGGWQRALVATSAAPFLASIAWPAVSEAHNA